MNINIPQTVVRFRNQCYIHKNYIKPREKIVMLLFRKLGRTFVPAEYAKLKEETSIS